MADEKLKIDYAAPSTKDPQPPSFKLDLNAQRNRNSLVFWMLIIGISAVFLSILFLIGWYYNAS